MATAGRPSYRYPQANQLIDWGLALGLSALAELQLGVMKNCCSQGAVRTSDAFLLTLLQTLPIVFRRLAPLPILLVTGAAAAVQYLLLVPSSDFGTVGVLVAFYTVADQSSRRLASSIAVLAAVGIAVAKLLDRSNELHVDDMMFLYAQFTAAWVLGDNARYRRRHLANLEERAVTDERARIARELHDVITHSLSVMMVQAGAARTVMDTRPESARACLRSIEAVGREAWTEMRHLLDLARQDGGGDGDDQPPRPSLRHLPVLVERFENAGLTVDLVVTGAPRPLPAAADLSLYRIVQEALTNTLKHAGPVRTRVSVAYDEQAVALEVLDDGGGPSALARDGRAGHGLVGMRERVRLFGGELATGPCGAGFAVRVRLPLEPPDP